MVDNFPFMLSPKKVEDIEIEDVLMTMIAPNVYDY